MPESAVDDFEGFRLDDEDLCIWRHEQDAALLDVRTEFEAEEMTTALAPGSKSAQEFLEFDAELQRVEAEPVP